MAADVAVPAVQRHAGGEPVMRAVRLLPLVCVAVVACGPHQELPRLTIPQLEQTKEEVQGGIGRRYQDHAACKQTARDAATMIACMSDKGYGYIARIAEPQATECWRLRQENTTDPLPEALCFVHDGAAPAAR